MKKIFKMLCIFICILTLSACNNEETLGEAIMYELSSEFHSLDIEIDVADFHIESGEKFTIVSNLKDLKIEEKNGILIVKHKTTKNISYTDAIFKLYIPDNIIFEEVEIKSGAGRFTLNSLFAKSIQFEFGAGQVNIIEVNAYSNIDIKGGTGEINILNGSFSNLSLVMGVGELNLIALLIGKSDLKFGISESNLTLIGTKDDYSFDIQAGIGNISIDGKKVSELINNENAQNKINIQGGLGEIIISFK